MVSRVVEMCIINKNQMWFSLLMPPVEHCAMYLMKMMLYLCGNHINPVPGILVCIPEEVYAIEFLQEIQQTQTRGINKVCFTMLFIVIRVLGLFSLYSNSQQNIQIGSKEMNLNSLLERNAWSLNHCNPP